MRLKATISYDGSKFFGFQRQKDTSNTVSQTIENALFSLGIKEKIIGSGRTDSGVHATGQVIHFDIPLFWQKKSLNELKYRLNSKLKYIQFNYIKYVDSSFHAQYSAKKRVYRYILKTTTPNVFERDYVSYYKISNSSLFKKALNLYIGKHNFKNFKKQGSQTTSDVREIFKIEIKEIRDYIAIYIYANGFLRSQVRIMVEGAILVEQQKITIYQLKEQLKLENKYFTTLAKPQGLYLHKIYY